MGYSKSAPAFSRWKNYLDRFFSQQYSIFTGLRPIVFVAVTIALCQGMNQIADLAISYLYKDNYGFGPVEVSFVLCITSIPWLIKPLWGAISDNISFFGYRRKSYIMLWSLLQIFYYFSLATWIRSPWLGVLFLMLIQVSLAFNNVIGEALLVEAAQDVGGDGDEPVSEEKKQAEASKNVSLFFGVKYFGTLTTAYLGGLLLEYIDKYTVFFFAGSLPFFVFLAGAFVMKETPRTSKKPAVPYEDIPDYIEGEDAHNYEDRESTIGDFARNDIHDEPYINQQSNWNRVVEFVKKPAILRPIIFLLIFMITPSCSSAMFYFYTNELKFSPDFMGQLRFANSIASILGVYTFNKYLKNIPFQKILYWSTIICVSLGLTQIILVLRWNSYLGIPDKFFSIGDSVIIQTIGEINYLPILILACRLCPKNIEGTMYALLMSTVNIGGMLASQIGGVLAYLLNINESNFDNLWILILIANLSMLIPLPFLRLVEFESAVNETNKESSSNNQKSAAQELK